MQILSSRSKDHINIQRSDTLSYGKMPRIVSEIPSLEYWLTHGPQTAVQRFINDYSERMDRKDFSSTSQRYFHPKVVIYNQNNAVYIGGAVCWTWVQVVFAPFEKMRTDMHHLYEIDPEDGSGDVRIEARGVRNVWMRGNKSEEPDVCVPVHSSWVIAKAKSEEAFEGLQFKEVRTFWDTALLIPFL